MPTQYIKLVGSVLIVFLLVGCNYVSAPDTVDESKDPLMEDHNTVVATPIAGNQNDSIEEEQRELILDGTEIILRGDDSTFPVNCRMTDVTQTLLRFFSAFNTGDKLALGEFFGPDLEWYSVTEGTYPQINKHFDGRTKEVILSYLVERHQFNEQLRPVEISMAYEAMRNIVHLNYVLEYSGIAAGGDTLTASLIRGKGAISCANRTIVAWSMVLDKVNTSNETNIPWPCSKVNKNHLLDRLLVCRPAL